MRGLSLHGSRLQTDFASHECRAAFFEHCKKSGMNIRERAKPSELKPDLANTRGERSERMSNDISNGSRGSETRRVSRRMKAEYDDELRRYKNERGKKYYGPEQCFTLPKVGSGRAVTAGVSSRSSSPPTGMNGPSPGQRSRSGRGRTSSDRESVGSNCSRYGSPVARESRRGTKNKPLTQAISPLGDSRFPGHPDIDLNTACKSSKYSTFSRDEGNCLSSPSNSYINVYTSSSSLLCVEPSVTDCKVDSPHGGLRTSASPPPSSDGSRPGTPLCDENPENLCRSAAAPVRLASHLRQQNSSEPMSLPLPRYVLNIWLFMIYKRAAQLVP